MSIPQVLVSVSVLSTIVVLCYPYIVFRWVFLKYAPYVNTIVINIIPSNVGGGKVAWCFTVCACVKTHDIYGCCIPLSKNH